MQSPQNLQLHSTAQGLKSELLTWFTTSHLQSHLIGFILLPTKLWPPLTMLSIKMVSFFMLFPNQHVLIHQSIDQSISVHAYVTHKNVLMETVYVFLRQHRQLWKLTLALKTVKRSFSNLILFLMQFYTAKQRPGALLWANNPFLVNQILSLTYHFL